MARNVPVSYRLGSIVLDDPVLAQDVVHDAAMAAWQAGSAWPPKTLDELFGRRLLDLCREADASPRARQRRLAYGAGETAADESRADAGAPDDADLEGVARLFDALPLDERLLLVERLGRGMATSTAGRSIGRGKATGRRLERAVEAAAGRTGGSREALERDLRRLFDARDPEDEPSQLRWRLQRSLVELDQATAEQAELSANTGWGFAVKALLVMTVVVLAVSVASISALNATATAQPPDVVPVGLALDVRSITPITVPAGAGAVRVGATSGSLIATLDVTALSHGTTRDCRDDVLGTTDASNAFAWRGNLGGHANLIAADPTSGYAYLVATGTLCDSRLLSSRDAGRTWGAAALAAGQLPPIGGDAASITWAGTDPARPGSLLLATDGRIWMASTGAGWIDHGFSGLLVGFDPGGRLVSWSNGRLLDSRDDGATWLILADAPQLHPTSGLALADGVLLGSREGLWWFPYSGDPLFVAADPILSMASASGAAFVLGSDAEGHPWMATFRTDPVGLSPAPLPADLLALHVSSGSVAVNPQHGLVALEANGRTDLFLVAFGD